MTNLKNYFSMHSNEFMLIFGSSRIGYDPVKEIKNRRKHHYSLQSAVHLLEKTIFPCGNDLRITIKQCVIKEEVRYNIMAFDDDKNIVLMVITMRHDDGKVPCIRIISFRRANEKEAKIFNSIIYLQ